MAIFVLVHGAMHGGWCWRRLVPLLQAAGHDVYVPTLTDLGERAHLAHPGIDLDLHIQDVVGVIAYEDLRNIVLVDHSYGAVVATGVADRMPDRIAHLVFLNGAEGADGQAVLDFFPPERRATWWALVNTEGGGWRLPPPADLSGWGIADEDDVAWMRPRLAPQPFETFTQPLRLGNADGFAGPKTFVACTEAPTASWRDAMTVRAGAGAAWRYRELATGHDAMVTAPGNSPTCSWRSPPWRRERCLPRANGSVAGQASAGPPPWKHGLPVADDHRGITGPPAERSWSADSASRRQGAGANRHDRGDSGRSRQEPPREQTLGHPSEAAEASSGPVTATQPGHP